MIDNIWQPYIDKIKQLEQAVKLTAYHTREAANQTRKASLNAYIVAEHVNDYIKGKTMAGENK